MSDQGKKYQEPISTQSAKAIMAYPKRCPVTGGLPTRMTEEGFVRACRVFLAEATLKRHTGGAGFYVRKNGWCRECGGEIRPKELEIISLKKIIVLFVVMVGLLCAGCSVEFLKNTVPGLDPATHPPSITGS